MKFKCLDTISLCYLKQNYSNKLISQSSTFTSNSASVCSLHGGQNNQTKTNLIMLHLCLNYFPCSHVLKMADKVLTSPQSTPPAHSAERGRVVMAHCDPQTSAQEQSPVLPQVNTAYPFVFFLALGCLTGFLKAQIACIPTVPLWQQLFLPSL